MGFFDNYNKDKNAAAVEAAVQHRGTGNVRGNQRKGQGC